MPVRPLSPELAEKARLELHEDPKRIESDLQHIRDWLDKQPHIRARKDDQWLIVFLRGCKFSLERVKAKLDLYYSLRSLAPEFSALTHHSDTFKDVLKLGVTLTLPKLATPDSPRVSILRIGKYNPDVYKVYDIFGVAIILQKIALHSDDATGVAGIINIVDMEGVTMGHFLQMTPTLMKKLAVITQEASPVRLKSSHFVNTPPGFDTFFNTMKSLFNEKMRNRLHAHKNFEELSKFIPKDILPAEYGGDGGTIEAIIDHWRRKVQEYSSWLDEEKSFGTDEQKRPGPPKTAETLFGVQGSFRQMEFD